MTRECLAVALAIAGLTAIGFIEFPGHAWLQQDTQIWLPMFERIWDPSVLVHDIVADKPHLSFTFYDEATMALRWIGRTSFHAVLTFEQLIFRALELLGVYLLARALSLSRGMALLVTACFGLGATIFGPAVLTIEYEPVPRGFAIGLVFLGVGLAASGRLMAASVAAAAAFVFHAPTSVPIWVVLAILAVRRRQYSLLVPLACGAAALFLASRFQVGVTETQPFFSRIDPEWERLERSRASYNWVSLWMRQLIWHYLFLWLCTVIAVWRIRTREAARWFVIGLPLIGILSPLVSYLLTEKAKWALMPQVQPARAMLFITAFAVILGAAAGIRAAGQGRWWESVLWFIVVFAIPMQVRVAPGAMPPVRLLALAAALAVLASAAAVMNGRRAGMALTVAAAIAPYFAIPMAGGIRNYPNLHTPELYDVAAFARERTPKDAVFLFPDAGQTLYPGLFRAVSTRPVYVDWKAGGQVNYFRSLAEDWWSRWQATMTGKNIPAQLDRFKALGINFVVLKKTNALAGWTPVYANSGYVVYRIG